MMTNSVNYNSYWKIMDLIFYGGDFQLMKQFVKKFEDSGFKTPPRKYAMNEIYGDKVFWKDPKELY